MKMYIKENKPSCTEDGQTFVEYGLLLGIVVSVLIAVSPMVRRATQGMVKLVSDQIGNQVNAEQDGGSQGYLEDSYTLSQVDARKRTIEYLGETEFIFDGTQTKTISTATTNLGFTKRPRDMRLRNP